MLRTAPLRATDHDDPAASTDAPRRGLILWCRRDQARFVERIVQTLGIDVLRVGFTPAAARPDQSAHTDDERPPFPEAERFDDLRHAVTSSTAAALLLADASPSSAGSASAKADDSPLDDPSFLRLCFERRMRLVSFEPAPASLERLSAVEAAEKDERSETAPLLAHARLFGDVRELLPHLGTLRTAVFTSRAAPAHGSLAARLFDAMAALHALMGLPDRIDCAITPSWAGSASVGALPSGAGKPHSMRTLSGHATAHLRYPGGQSAAVALSNQAGPWFRGLTLLGDRATLRLSDDALELLSPTGEPLERSDGRAARPRLQQDDPEHHDPVPAREAPTSHTNKSERRKPDDAGSPTLFAPVDAESAAAKKPPTDPAVAVFAEELRRVLDPGIRPAVRVDRAETLAMCETALLSSRTGNPEHTQTLLNISGARR